MAGADETARERILDAAERLIYRNGVHATGVDAVLQEANASRVSLYRHFGSKDQLTVEMLERRDDRWMDWFRTETRRRAPKGPERIPAMFDALKQWFSQPDFRGCAFINVSGEHADADHPIRRVANRHKRRLAEFVTEVCADAGHDDATVSRGVFLLIEGSIVAAMMERNPAAADQAKAFAALLLRR